jgi:O-6-methylguanine DNA methyltransferase
MTERKSDSGSDEVVYLPFSSPIGWILLAATSRGICLLDFRGGEEPTEFEVRARLRATGAAADLADLRDGSTAGANLPLSKVDALLHEARQALAHYFNNGAPIPDLPLDLARGTEFQRKVWRGLCQIPFGQTRSYIDVSRSIGHSGASRAVGAACGRNPVAILVPCHRVLTAGGKLGGYSGGLEIKRSLLALEGIKLPPL